MTVYDIQPYVGGIVLTTEGLLGHVAYIEAVTGTSLTVSEANYIPGRVTSRTLSLDSPVIRGYQ
jgi:surface antigen